MNGHTDCIDYQETIFQVHEQEDVLNTQLPTEATVTTINKSPVYRTHKLSVHREDSAISVRALVGHEVGHRSEAGERMRRCTGCTLYKTKCTRQAIKRTHPTHPPMTNPAPPGPDHVTIAKGVGRKN